MIRYEQLQVVGVRCEKCAETSAASGKNRGQAMDVLRKRGWSFRRLPRKWITVQGSEKKLGPVRKRVVYCPLHKG